MDSLDGTFDDVTGTLTITAGKHCDFENFLNEVYVTNGTDVPFKYDGTSAADISNDLATNGVTTANFIKLFNNYLFIANVTVSGVRQQSRIYWSNLKSTTTWTSTDFIDIAKDDGQDITGLRVLSDRLVVFKRRSIYNVFFTGDSDVPFILPGGGKANSAVGCVAPWSIQEIDNGLIFLSHDGFYYYDGSNSVKISDKITTTILSLNVGRFDQAVSLTQKDKNRYWCSLPSSGVSTNDTVLVWDWSLNAWSKYSGMAAAAMTTVYVDGEEERPYWSDYVGFTYRGDTSANDNPAASETAIAAYLWTNWKHFGDLIDKKGLPYVTVYYQSANSVLTLGYSYDFETGTQRSQTFSLATGTDTYGTGVYGTAVYAGAGGAVKRRTLTGRGRVVRFKFENNVKGETFQIDGLGTFPHLETVH